MLGDDERVRVMDFGLARAVGRDETTPAGEDPTGAEASMSPTLTTVGTVMGTPAYMAPEQFAGAEVDTRSDQFAFCVSLFEALHGQRPFTGGNLRALAAAVQGGEIREPPRRGAPRWLRRLVTRGLAVDPGQRWPGMPVLLARIERGQALARLRIVAAVLVLLGLAGLGVWLAHQADLARREAACSAAGAAIEEVWSDETHARLGDAFASTGAKDALDTLTRVAPWLGHQAAAWRAARTDACLNADRGAWAPESLDRALWCLDDRRADLDALVTELARADRSVLQKAVPAAAGLDPVGPCLDLTVLARLPPPPLEGREEARAVRAEFSRIGGLAAAGRFKEIPALAAAALTRAEALGWPPLLAEARLRVAQALEREGKYAEAEPALEDAGFAAMQAGALGVAADATISLVSLVGQQRAKYVDAVRWSRLGELLIATLEPEPGLRTGARLGALAVVRALTGDLAEAEALQERALAIYEQALGSEHPRVGVALHNLAITQMNLGRFDEALATNQRALTLREAALGAGHNDVARTLGIRAVILRNTGKYDEALAINQRVLAATEELLGPEHPDVAVVLTNIANIDLQRGALDQVEPLHQRALQIRERALGPEHPDVAATLSNLGAYYHLAGRYAEAREVLRRSLVLREKAFGPEHREVATSLSNLALVERYLDHAAEARALQERALAILEKVLGPEHSSLAPVFINLGELDLEADRLAEARARLERGVALLERTFGPEHPDLEHALMSLAEVALAARRPADAVPLASRALAQAEARGAAVSATADLHWVLARALWDAPVGRGRDRGRARREAQAARDGFRGSPGAEDHAARVERWLAKHRR